MKSNHTFTCTVCLETIGNLHLSLDRRIEKITVMQHDGKPVTTINIAERETLFMYCSHECWQVHESTLSAAMELTQTFPAFSFVTPCCRCGKAVNRTQHYFCCSISEMSFQGDEQLIAQCIDDHDYAVLCRNCEPPGLDAQEQSSDVDIDEAVPA
jgi:hypothetical protein